MDTADHTYRDVVSLAVKLFGLDEESVEEWWTPRVKDATDAWAGAGFPVLLSISMHARNNP